MFDKTKTIQRECDRCGKQHDAVVATYKVNEHRTLETILGRFCDDCCAVLNAELDATEGIGVVAGESPEMKRFMEICPFTGSRESKIEKFPVPEATVRKVADWNPKSKSLMVSGASGLGKSRAAWMAIKRIMLDEKKDVIATDCQTLGIAIADSLRSDNGGSSNEAGYNAYVKRLKNCDLLYIDDLGKGIFTERYKSALYDIVKYRCEFGKPMLITTNHTIKYDKVTGVSGLAQRIAMSSETQVKFIDQTADAIVRRLIEYSDGVKFEIPEKNKITKPQQNQ